MANDFTLRAPQPDAMSIGRGTHLASRAPQGEAMSLPRGTRLAPQGEAMSLPRGTRLAPQEEAMSLEQGTSFIGNYNFGDNGVIIPDTIDIQETVQQEFKNALGEDLSLEESTPQGRLIDVETQARKSTIDFCAQAANNFINITMSSGSALDAWAANFDIYRNGATSSNVSVVVGGIADTVIPAGSQATDAKGNIWQVQNEIIIGADGNATGSFQCLQTGPISLGIGELNTIVASTTTGIVGWETITNPTIATLGELEESDYSLKNRLLNSLFNASALFGNYASAAYKVANVKDVFVKENPYGKELILDNITIPAHSVFVCIDGGNSEDIAMALYKVKSAGCGWFGNTYVTIVDPDYNTTNTVIYNTPTSTPIKIEVAATSLSNSTSNLTQEIQNIIINYAQGLYQNQGYQKLGIRALLSPFTIAGLLNSQISGVNINQVNIGLIEPTPRAAASIIKKSITSGIIWASVETSVFDTKINQNGTYNFIYNGTNWVLNDETVNLADYGITISTVNNSNPITGDIISIIFSNGNMSQNPIKLYASEKPLILAENITVNING